MGKVFLDSCMIFPESVSASGKEEGENHTAFPVYSSQFLFLLNSGLLLKLPDVKILIGGNSHLVIYISGTSGKQSRRGLREEDLEGDRRNCAGPREAPSQGVCSSHRMSPSRSGVHCSLSLGIQKGFMCTSHPLPRSSSLIFISLLSRDLQTCAEGAVSGGSVTAVCGANSCPAGTDESSGRVEVGIRISKALTGISLGKEHVPTLALDSALAGASHLGCLLKERPARREGSSSLPALGFGEQRGCQGALGSRGDVRVPRVAEGMSVLGCPGEQRGIVAVVRVSRELHLSCPHADRKCFGLPFSMLGGI